MVFERFDKMDFSDQEKIKKTRNFLGKTYSAFFSERILSSKAKEKGVEWFLKRHLSTRERFYFFEEVPSINTLLGAGLIVISSGIIFFRENQLKKPIPLPRQQ